MLIETRYFGEVEVEGNEVITFEQGLPGFVDEKKFVIIPFADEETPLSILQSTGTPSLAFVIANPFMFYKDYEFTIPEGVLGQLKIKDEKEVAVFVILTVEDPFENTTANLKAPIVLKVEERVGKQVVLNDDNYHTKHKLIQEPLSAIKGES
ncbi:flagellar assembly protein FliW [Pseudalkalibacillus sp. Hm43]|uniref:flagellar assembly protein FliW n=1 Tax=Pseudalkalibacillus sp. Hm43 TaxID=3450742 RepID=UPI003F42F1BF